MAHRNAYDPLADSQSRAYMALWQIRDLMAAANLDKEATPHIAALAKLIGRAGRGPAGGRPGR